MFKLHPAMFLLVIVAVFTAATNFNRHVVGSTTKLMTILTLNDADIVTGLLQEEENTQNLMNHTCTKYPIFKIKTQNHKILPRCCKDTCPKGTH